MKEGGGYFARTYEHDCYCILKKISLQKSKTTSRT